MCGCFGVRGLGCGVQCLVLEVWVWGLGFKILGLHVFKDALMCMRVFARLCRCLVPVPFACACACTDA